MIVTLTANPSLDRTVALAGALVPGEVQHALSAREDAGGKGINVAGVIAAAGEPALAVLPLAPDDAFRAVLAATGLAWRAVPITGRVRANTTITDPAGVTTKLNLPGAQLSAEERAALITAVVEAAEEAQWLVLAGSLPPGAGEDFYVDVIRAVRERWGDAAPRIAVDTSGAPLRAVVEQGLPDLIKPNETELAELAGVDLDPDADLAAAVATVARALVPAKVRAAFVTLGGEGGVLVDASGALAATPPPITVVSTVGAGDSSLAGFLLAEAAGADRADVVRSGIRYGSAAASLPGTRPPAAADLPVGDIPVTVVATP